MTYFTKVNIEKNCHRFSMLVVDLEDLCSSTVKCIVQFSVPLPCCNVETKWLSMNTETGKTIRNMKETYRDA